MVNFTAQKQQYVNSREEGSPRWRKPAGHHLTLLAHDLALELVSLSFHLLPFQTRHPQSGDDAAFRKSRATSRQNIPNSFLVRRFVNIAVDIHSVEPAEAWLFLTFHGDVGVIGRLALVKIHLFHFRTVC